MAAMGAVSTSGRFECAGFVKLWLVQGLQLFVRLILKPLSIPLSLSPSVLVCLSVCLFVCLYLSLSRALSGIIFDVVVSLLFVCGSGSSSMLVGSWVARCVDSSI